MFSCAGTTPTFANIAAGNYRIWAVLRAITFLPYQYCANSSCSSTTLALPVLHSHYNISSVFANNGTSPGFVAANTLVTAAGVESGGDMAGSVFNRQADMDYFDLTGNEFLTWIE